MINLIMPMAGGGTRFLKEGFTKPKPLIEIKKLPFFVWSTRSVLEHFDCNIFFIILKEHSEKFGLAENIKKYFPTARIKVIPKTLRGATLTVLEGIDMIDNKHPIIINDCDHIFRSSALKKAANNNVLSEIDGGLLTFKSRDPKYSFIKLDQKGKVIGTVEKEAVSDQAICGAYIFNNKNIFKKYTERYLDNCAYKEFFISGIYNEMVADQMNIKNFCCDIHIPFGTPEEYRISLNNEYFERK